MPRKRPPSTVQLGIGGLKHSWGQVQEEFHPRLQGTKAARVYEEMASNDAAIGAVLYVIEAFLRRVDWKVEPASVPGDEAGPSEEAEAEAAFLESCMNDMDQSWSDFISDVLSFLTYGYALHEIVYKIRRGRAGDSPRFQSAYDDGRIGWRAIETRAQNTIDGWEFEGTSSAVLGAWQKNPNDFNTVFLPIEKCVLFRTRSAKGNPEGRSILRTAYRSWYMKKRLEEVEAIGINRDLTGIPVIEAPVAVLADNATDAQRALRSTLQQIASRLQRDEAEGLVFPAERDADDKPTGFKLKLLSSPGQKQIPADPVIRRYESRMLMSMSAEFLMLGTEKQGSFALGATKSQNFVKSLEWYINAIADTLNRTAVARLYDANNVPPEFRARIVPGDLDRPDLKDLGLFLSYVASAGLVHPTPKVEARLRELADLPIEEDELENIFAEEKQAEQEQQRLEAEMAQAGATQAAGQPPEAPPAQVEPSEPSPEEE